VPVGLSVGGKSTGLGLVPTEGLTVVSGGPCPTKVGVSLTAESLVHPASTNRRISPAARFMEPGWACQEGGSTGLFSALSPFQGERGEPNPPTMNSPVSASMIVPPVTMRQVGVGRGEWMEWPGWEMLHCLIPPHAIP
jgi:hypothetical protein